jgi:glutamyl-tRNA reductase
MKTDKPTDLGGTEGPFLFGISFNHHHADLETRERLQLSSNGSSEFAEALRKLSALNEFVLLDTCNRWELYASGESEILASELWEQIFQYFPLNSEELVAIGEPYRGCAMIQHLFEVCSGLDSQMVGETEILGQVKAAYKAHSERGDSGTVFARVFAKAFQAAKAIRTETSIGRGQVSIGNISVDLAQRIFGSLKHCKVLLIGSGEVGRLVATAMNSRNARSISVASRNRQNAQHLADELGADVIDFPAVPDRLGDFDIVLSCTSATEAVLTKDQVLKARKRRAHKPLFLIDLAMPRDIEPSVSSLPQVFLYNLDDVSAIANENMQSRSEELERCRKMLSRKSWVAWLESMRRYQMGKLKVHASVQEISKRA